MFLDRIDAGRQLAQRLLSYRGQPVAVCALPRGGAVLGAEVARALDAPLDLIVVRKIGHPHSPEYAIGAVSADGETVINSAEAASLDPLWLAQETERLRVEAVKRRDALLGGRSPVDVQGKTAIVVDDGIATGLSVEAAIRQLRKRNPAKVIVAAPVAAEETAEELTGLVDEVVFLIVPRGFFGAISAFYEDFDQLSDSDIIELMKSQRAGS